MQLAKHEKAELLWLMDQRRPCWGGHLGRGQPLSDQCMRSWLERGLIRQEGRDGYVVTDLGRKALTVTAADSDAPNP